MRGGTAHCTVIISDDEIGSPVVMTPTAAIVMNLPSLVKYESLIKPEGVLVVNKSLVNQTPTRKDIDVIEIAANQIAEEIGNPRLTNLVLVGSLLQRLPVFSMDVVRGTLDKHIPERHRDLLEANILALTRGFQEAEENRIKV
jgi:2-oxoglutarate ferredoxin oxidoreductase subunit gamma